MLKNYFKIAFRNLARNKAFSFINIFGLAVGLSTCMLIMLYIFSEIGYDKFKDSERVFRIAYSPNLKLSPTGKAWAASAGPIAAGLRSDIPEVEQSTRLLKFPTLDKMLLKYEHGEKSTQYYETNGYYVDSTFFQVFTYNFKYGNPLTAFNEPNSVVLSEDVAGKIFGNENPINKAIDI